MAADMFVVRHGDSGAAHFIAEHVCPQVAIINGGDGRHAHPTQGMLDMLTIRRHKGGFENLSVAIVGDILHSRVARSNMIALKTLGCKDIRVIAPKTLLPIGIEQYGKGAVRILFAQAFEHVQHALHGTRRHTLGGSQRRQRVVGR